VDSATIAVCVGAVGIAIGQWFTMRTVNVNAINARNAAAATACEQAAALKEAARLQDERAERDRRWLKEDRAELARSLEAKVQATADTLAAKVQATADTLAAKNRDHAGMLAESVRADQQALSTKVDSATTQASEAVGELKEMVSGVGDDARAAYHEANGAKVLIADVNKNLVDEVKRRNDIQLGLANGKES